MRFANGDEDVAAEAQRLAYALAKTETTERTRRPAPRVAERRTSPCAAPGRPAHAVCA